MSELKLQPDTGSNQAGEQTASFPALSGAGALSNGPRRTSSVRASRRRSSSSLFRPKDDGFHLFRIY